jgi:chromosome segregation ATPase
MLQDLDSLAARIGQLVQFVRQLLSERTALQARLKNLEQERDALRDQLQRREAEFADMTNRVDGHDAQVRALQADLEAAQATLQVETSRYKGEADLYRQKLAASQADTSRLQSVADKAKEHIDSILMRLPGAAQE